MVSQFVDSLIELGVEEVISCPGGRSAAILNQIIETKKFKVESFYDERSAGFYALGKALKTNKPVVVLTTSGSAAVALYPALLEARYQEGAKLIAVTADRPKEFIGTGAPQTIHQKNLFLENGIKTRDCKELNAVNAIEYPVHINVPLEDPNSEEEEVFKYSFDSLVIISSLKENERSEVKRYLANYAGALVLEPLSNLAKEDFPKASVIKHGEDFVLKAGLKSFKEIYRVGGVPVFKPWRESRSHPKVYFWNQYEFPGTVNAKGVSLEEIAKKTLGFEKDEAFEELIKEFDDKVKGVITSHPLSEVSKFIELGEMVPEGSQVFIGNSMPIREWPFVNWSKFKNIGQRGVNGIDGSLALALGALDKDKENWIILGDLTSLYNVNDLQALKYLKDYKIRLVVVNNSGGRIFERIFDKNTEYFINKQNCSFKNLAAFWSLDHLGFAKDLKLSKHCLVELKISHDASVQFWNNMSGIKL
ncbi:MAG: thiamine pyrophosphate-binding protein [Bdellovibrionales bacterium]